MRTHRKNKKLQPRPSNNPDRVFFNCSINFLTQKSVVRATHLDFTKDNSTPSVPSTMCSRFSLLETKLHNYTRNPKTKDITVSFLAYLLEKEKKPSFKRRRDQDGGNPEKRHDDGAGRD